jgi:DNA-directed RNA polymerase II subunit RPB11|eukprot:196235_1
MNAPERSACFLLDEDNAEEKVTYASDTKVSNAGTFTFNKEDHTVGNLISQQLLRDSFVRFSGYRIPHPLVNKIEMKVQTTSSTLAPIDVLYNAVEDLIEETSTLEREAKTAIERWKKENNSEGVDALSQF